MVGCVVLNYNDSKTTIELINRIEKMDSIDVVVIVDNNSTDDSFSVLKQYASEKIHVIQSDKNGGYGYGNNCGIEFIKKNYDCDYIIIANPDVILVNTPGTNEAGLTAIEDVESRDGWDTITAVQNGAVYSIDNNASSRPSQNVIKALKEIAKAIYPDEYKEL